MLQAVMVVGELTAATLLKKNCMVRITKVWLPELQLRSTCTYCHSLGKLAICGVIPLSAHTETYQGDRSRILYSRDFPPQV